MARDLIVKPRDLGIVPGCWNVYQSSIYIPEHCQWVATVEVPDTCHSLDDCLAFLFAFCQNDERGNWSDQYRVVSSLLEPVRSCMVGDLFAPVDSPMVWEVMDHGFQPHLMS